MFRSPLIGPTTATAFTDLICYWIVPIPVDGADVDPRPIKIQELIESGDGSISGSAIRRNLA
ncbi:MAG: hypothetical protein GY939_28970 [Actinomycetia bacterium]|nr:hypothetical protein [Actinomycetes bacterium]